MWWMELQKKAHESGVEFHRLPSASSSPAILISLRCRDLPLQHFVEVGGGVISMLVVSHQWTTPSIREKVCLHSRPHPNVAT